MLLLLGIVLLITDYRAANQEIEKGLKKNNYGQGSRIEELQIQIDGGERKSLEVEVPEKIYEEEEVDALFQRCILKMEEEMKGDNQSLDRVEKDLNLMNSLPNEPVEINWKLDHYEVMNIYGQIQNENLSEKGTLVQLEAVLTYTENQELQTIYQCAAMVYPPVLEGKEKLFHKIKTMIAKESEDAGSDDYVKLPKSVDGASVAYFYQMNDRGIVLLVLAVLIGILFYLQELQNSGKELQNRRNQMLLDYPEIINKLTLFLGAGMNMKRAWKKIVQDYEAGRNLWGTRYAYEEMKIACREMERGVTEYESYERFGKRCNTQEYIRLGALLSQNVRKGTKGLSQILRLEAVQAFENRKAYAKKAGEEAGTKLLVPMFLMLAVVLVMVTIPAFLSMKV